MFVCELCEYVCEHVVYGFTRVFVRWVFVYFEWHFSFVDRVAWKLALPFCIFASPFRRLDATPGYS